MAYPHAIFTSSLTRPPSKSIYYGQASEAYGRRKFWEGENNFGQKIFVSVRSGDMGTRLIAPLSPSPASYVRARHAYDIRVLMTIERRDVAVVAVYM